MAERRMFAKTIIDSDAFLDMPLSTQALYFHLSMRADDEGFINNPKKISRMIGSSDDDLKLLLVKKFIIAFESGVVVIKHWRIHNYIRADRLQPTNYEEERAMLELKDNGAYTFSEVNVRQVSDKCQTSVSIGKDSIGKDSIGNIESKPTRHKYGKYSNILLSDDDFAKWKEECHDWSTYIERMSEYCASSGKTYKNYLAALRNWYRKDGDKPKESAPSYDIDQFKNESIHKTLKYERKKNNE